MTTRDATPASDSGASWADRAVDRSPSVQRSRTRSVQQIKVIVDAAGRLIRAKGASFTTQDLVREAGVALQTFYRHFAGKDQLLLAVFEEEIVAGVARLDAAARELPDPIARLRMLITSPLESLCDRDGDSAGSPYWYIGPRFVTAEHWRLYQLFPDEMARINQCFATLIERELRAAAAENVLRSADPAGDAWLVMKLVMSVYHHYAFASAHEPLQDIAERLWAFCLASFNGAPPGTDVTAPPW